MMDLEAKPSKQLQFIEIGLALAFLGSVSLTLTLSHVDLPVLPLGDLPLEYIGDVIFVWSMCFLIPLALGATALLSLFIGQVGIGTVIAGITALLMVPVMLYGLAGFIVGPGGIVLAPYLSLAAGFFLALAVLIKPVIDRATARVWHRPGLMAGSQ